MPSPLTPPFPVHRETTTDERPARGFSSSSTDCSDSEEGGGGPPAEQPHELPHPLVTGATPPPDAGGAAAGLSMNEVNRYAPLVLVCHGNVIRFLTLKALQLNTAAWLRLIVPQCVHVFALLGSSFDPSDIAR